MENIATQGIHIWKLQCDKGYPFDQIGIRNVDTESLKLEGGFDEGHDKKRVVGYAFVLKGAITNAQHADSCVHGDSIEMRLDFINLALNFKINDINWIL